MDKALELMQFVISHDADWSTVGIVSTEEFLTLKYKVLDESAIHDVVIRRSETCADNRIYISKVDTDYGDDIARLVAAGRSIEPVRIRPTMVIVNQPAVVVFFSDGTKVVSQARETDDFDLAMGLLTCSSRRWRESDGGSTKSSGTLRPRPRSSSTA